MMILDYYIPKELRGNDKIRNLGNIFRRKGKLTPKQKDLLEDLLEIDMDFLVYDITLAEDDPNYDDWSRLTYKLYHTKWQKASTRNRCIRCILSCLRGAPNKNTIDQVLNPSAYWAKNRGYWR